MSATANGATPEEIREFLSRPERDRQMMIYVAARTAASRSLDLYNGNGAMLTAMADVAAAVRDLTATARTLGGLPVAAKPSSLPPPRGPAPSYLEFKDEDLDVVRQIKERAKVDRAILERWATWGKRVIFAGAIIAALGTIGGAIGGALWAIANYAHDHAQH